MVAGGRYTGGSSSKLVSVIVPTYHDAQRLAMTLESILTQERCRLEVLVINASPDDQAVERVVRTDTRVRMQPAPSWHRFEMINRGVALARGEYLNVLFPGDSYVMPDAVEQVLWHITHEGFPDLFYTGVMAGKRLSYGTLTQEKLRAGRLPTGLQGCWFKTAMLREIGPFDTTLQWRGDADMFWRLLQREWHVASEERVYAEIAPELASWRATWETARVIQRYSGWWRALRWIGGRRAIWPSSHAA